MPRTKPTDANMTSFKTDSEAAGSEEEREDYLDYCASAEAIDEALEEGGVKKTRDFAKELGFDF